MRISRREWIGAVTSATLLRGAESGPARMSVPLNEGWLFGRDGTKLAPVSLPHIVTKLSWQDWNPASWQETWLYRRQFSLTPEMRGRRVFVEFDGVMTTAAPSINGHALPKHLGGYLPFRYEITDYVKDTGNALDVAVDSHWLNVPPDGNPKGPVGVDYLEPGGIYRGVSLSAVPQVFISDVFAKPVQVLDAARRVEVACTLDAATVPKKAVQVRCELRNAGRVIARTEKALGLTGPRPTVVALTLSNLGNIELWDTDHPHLYNLVTTLLVDGKPVHDHAARIGFRDARFELDGFFLNGKRVQLFGLNRHEIYPYVAGAMPARVMRRDAEMLRREFNCNIVRCSHYPQSEAFLNACDELGLMVWEETPGWGYLGDQAWQEIVVQNVRDMVLRDRNHASIVIWGVRVNESRNEPALYKRTTELAKELDGTRATSGSMTPGSQRTWQQDWKEDVYAFDDYHAEPDGSVGIQAPLPGVPYMLAEAVGQFNYSARKNFDAKYTRSADMGLQTAQALRHAQAHDRAAGFPRCAGVIAWCAFDYASLLNAYRAVKTPGVADVFRIPKLGAAFYQSQVSPREHPVILPDFYWDSAVAGGPGNRAAIFSNCERLAVFLNGTGLATLEPDRAGFPHLRYPPFFCDFPPGSEGELRIDGYVGQGLVLSKSFTSDRSRDGFVLQADDAELLPFGGDATRVVFRIVDAHGAPRSSGTGEVKFSLTGPGDIIGDNPFHLSDSGGVGAIWVKAGRSAGRIELTATHSELGAKKIAIQVSSQRARG